MATEKGVWDLQEVRDKQLASEWSYDGALNMYMVGTNADGGMLGNNKAFLNASSPIQLPGNWKSYSGTYTNSIATKTDGTLWSWGYNSEGALGQNDTTNYSSPVQIPGTTWDKCLLATEGSAFSTKTDGSLWSWGKNNAGQLGHNNKTEYSSPRQVPGEWTYFSGGDQSSLQIKSGGTVWFTGWGEKYANGIGSQTGYSSPRQVPGSPGAGPFGTATVVASMENGTGLVINTDGELFSWGYNTKGQCGKNTNNNATQYYSPQQIPGTTWSHIDTARFAVYAQKTDGTLWNWGNNNAGNLGQNNTVQRSSPTQLGTSTNWQLDRFKSYKAAALGLIEQQ